MLTIFQRAASSGFVENHPLGGIKSSSALLASDCRAAQLFGDLNAGVSINFVSKHFMAQKFSKAVIFTRWNLDAHLCTV